MFAPAQPKLAASRSNVRQQQPQQQQSQNRKEGRPPIPDPTELPSFLMSLSQIEDPRLAASQQAQAGPNSAELDLERDALRRSVTSALSKVRSASSKLSFHELLRDELASTGARLELMDELGPRPAAGAPGNQPSAPLAPAQGGEPPQASAPPAAASAPALHELQDPQETSDEPGAAPVVLSRPLELGETGSVGAAEVVSAAVPSYDYGAVEGVPAVISPRAEQRLEQRQSLLSRLFGRFSPGQKQEQQQQHHQQQPGEQAPKEGSVPPLHFNPLGRSTALIRVRAWEQSPQQQQQQGQGEQQQQQPDGEPTVFIPTEEVALVDLDDLWTVVQPEVRFDPMPEEGLVLGLSRNNSRADGSQLLLDNEHELKEGLVSAEGGRVVARANPKHQVRQAPQAYQSLGPGGALEVIEPSRIQGDDDGFLIVDDALVDRALADFLAQLFLENQGRNRRVVRNLTPDQLKDLVRGSIERVSADYDEGTWASLWRWAKLLYTVYGWGSTALSLYQRPFIVRLVVRSAWSVARWVIVLVL